MIKHFLQKFWPFRTAEEEAYMELQRIDLSKGDIAIDCGANVGEVTKHLCRNGATVYAFEPNPYAFEKLSYTFAENEQVNCIQKGVWDKNCTTKLYLHENSDEDEVHWSTGSSMLKFKGNVRKDKYIEIETVDLSAFIKSLHSRVKLLKMDVEGVEYEILRNLIDTGVVDQIDHIFVETHESKIPELNEEIEELREIIESRNISNINLNWT